MGKDEASGSPWISSLPENSASATPSPAGPKNESCFSAVSPVSGWKTCVKWVAPFSSAHSFIAERDRVGERRVERLALLQGALQAPVGVLGQPRALHRRGEDVLAERVVRRLREVGRTDGATVGAPLRGGDVVLANPWHVV